MPGEPGMSSVVSWPNGLLQLSTAEEVHPPVSG